jgi:hypothetical protein
MNIHTHIFVGINIFIYLGYMHRSGNDGSHSNLRFNSLSTGQIVFQNTYIILQFYQQSLKIPNSFTFLLAIHSVCSFNFNYPKECKTLWFGLHFSKKLMILEISMCLMHICILSLEKCMYKSHLKHLKIG